MITLRGDQIQGVLDTLLLSPSILEAFQSLTQSFKRYHSPFCGEENSTNQIIYVHGLECLNDP